ncbi:Leucyl/phenylalanyl-tRNA--protein transferase [Labeo rohita]|uniref:Leucyl/phenylalanyl-tRNA--protein transferase n=1 Tax=Labeo rohita TaxID=84645 RepID=A0ABQ8LN18_LABRO|nr:Leucyl/phenylalanyl-tRNA--protein transferase [Labeo rohita]
MPFIKFTYYKTYTTSQKFSNSKIFFCSPSLHFHLIQSTAKTVKLKLFILFKITFLFYYILKCY